MMNKTTINNSVPKENKMLVNTETLAGILDCGRKTAVNIGTEAQARVQIGKRLLWNVEKVKRYVDMIAL